MTSARRDHAMNIGLAALYKDFRGPEWSAFAELPPEENAVAFAAMEAFALGRAFEIERQKARTDKAIDRLIGLDAYDEAGVHG